MTEPGGDTRLQQAQLGRDGGTRYHSVQSVWQMGRFRVVVGMVLEANLHDSIIECFHILDSSDFFLLLFHSNFSHHPLLQDPLYKASLFPPPRLNQENRRRDCIMQILMLFLMLCGRKNYVEQEGQLLRWKQGVGWAELCAQYDDQ